MKVAIIIILSYLIGSVPFGLIIGKWGYGVDIRQHGSGNLGGTNAFRALGKKAGLMVSAGDVLKGTLAASLPLLFHLQLHPLIAGLPAIIGHCYPLFARFKGGKAVATTGGVLLFYQPVIFLIALGVFFLTLYLTKYVSLSSMVAGLTSVIISYFLSDLVTIILMSTFTIFLVYRHRANIKRLYQKTEPKVKWI